MPISRDKPLKQNIRVWYNYLQTAIRHDYKINKEYYRSWHLSKVKNQRFDEWWKSHSHLFAHKEYLQIRVDNSLSMNDAIKEVKKQLVGKVDKKSSFQITGSKRFRYLQVDDYLKCFIRRKEKGQQYAKIGMDLMNEYLRKESQYSKSTKLVRRKFTKKKLDEWKSPDKKDVMFQIVRRKVRKAEVILKNTASGEFTGKY